MEGEVANLQRRQLGEATGSWVKKEDDWARFQALCRKIMLARMTQEKFEDRRRTRKRRRSGTQI